MQKDGYETGLDVGLIKLPPVALKRSSNSATKATIGIQVPTVPPFSMMAKIRRKVSWVVKRMRA